MLNVSQNKISSAKTFIVLQKMTALKYLFVWGNQFDFTQLNDLVGGTEIKMTDDKEAEVELNFVREKKSDLTVQTKNVKFFEAFDSLIKLTQKSQKQI